MLEPRLSAHITLPVDLALALFDAASEAARASAKAAAAKAPKSRPSRGLTLHPGKSTPIWNEVRQRLQVHLLKRGAKTNLARVLGIPRQRINDYLRAGSALPDGERALFLLCWLAAAEQGQELTA